MQAGMQQPERYNINDQYRTGHQNSCPAPWNQRSSQMLQGRRVKRTDDAARYEPNSSALQPPPLLRRRHCTASEHQPVHVASHHQKAQFVDRLTTSLTQVVSQKSIHSICDIEPLIDQLNQQITRHQDALGALYSDKAEHMAVLESLLLNWQKNAIASLNDQLPPHILKKLKESLAINFMVIVSSLQDVPEITPANSAHRVISADSPRTRPCRTQHTHPGHNHSPSFYFERQQSSQCSRHAMNAFYGKPCLPFDSQFENFSADSIFQTMLNIEKSSNTPQKLSFYQHSLMENGVDEQFSPVVWRKEIPTMFDNINGDRLILCTYGHHVCFRKRTDGEWYLLDSLRYPHISKMKPSEYLRERVPYISDQEYLNQPNRMLFSVICAEEVPGATPYPPQSELTDFT